MRLEPLLLIIVACGPAESGPLAEGLSLDESGMAPKVREVEVERRQIPPALARYLLTECDDQLDWWRATCKAEADLSGRDCGPVVEAPVHRRDPCRFLCDCDGVELLPPPGTKIEGVYRVPLP